LCIAPVKGADLGFAPSLGVLNELECLMCHFIPLVIVLVGDYSFGHKVVLLLFYAPRDAA
jgi:hypothetical protein